MEKFVSFRIEKVDNNKVIGQVNHDMRIGHIPKYIDKTRLNLNYTLEGQKMDNDTLKKHKREQNKRSKRKIQKNTDRYFKGIMTFSENMSEDFENDRELFEKCSKTFINALKSQNINNLYAEVHLDEKTPHIHLLFDNIGENGKSVRRNINPDTLSKLQDLMGECFAPMGYKRGKPKNQTMAKHINFKEYHKVTAYIMQLKDQYLKMKEKSQNYKNELKIFDKIVDNKPLDSQEKEILKAIAPNLFQFVEKGSQVAKKQLSQNISKILKNP